MPYTTTITVLTIIVISAATVLFLSLSPGTLYTPYNYDVLVVGAGISGAVVADVLSSKGFKVLVIDKRSHIAGNCYDFENEHGILLHKYGPHIFHTNDAEVWNYITSKSKWRHYVHFVMAYVNGTPVPFPVNRVTLNMLFKVDLKNEEDVENFLKEESKEYANLEVTNSEELILKTFGKRVYQALYENYNKKMWKMPASKLAAAVSARIPWRKTIINRYFDDRFQALPDKSYTEFVQKLLYHENITVITDMPMEKLDNRYTFKKVYYTGLIDGLCDFKLGTLPYLSLNISWQTFQDPLKVLPAPVVNYPNDNTYHRVFEAKWINPTFSNYSTLSYETSTLDGEPYYAIPNTTNHKMYERYKNAFSSLKRMVIYGRLGDYKYYNMDSAIARALEIGKTTYADINSFEPISIEKLKSDIKNTCSRG